MVLCLFIKTYINKSLISIADPTQEGSFYINTTHKTSHIKYANISLKSVSSSPELANLSITTESLQIRIVGITLILSLSDKKGAFSAFSLMNRVS